ncbi:protoheme IX farnesyltransferase [Microbacterium sp. ZKA21]
MTGHGTCGESARQRRCRRLEQVWRFRAEEGIEISTQTQSVAPKHSLGRTVKAYVALTKPRVLELLLVSTVPVMFLAEGGLPDLWLVLATVIGGAMSAGSAAAFNMYLDRDIDAHMHRTENRPLVTGEVTPRGALIFSWTLAVVSTIWLWLTTNWLAAALSAVAIFFYVVIYTMILKRRTEQNIVWGGIAGCFPVLIGWAAVTESLDWPAFILFLLVFLWTPPHYWPLSMKYKDDYEDVDVPMLGVTRHASQVGLQVILYAWATVACSLLLIPVAGMGLVYTVSAAVFGGWFIYESHRLYNRAVRGTEPRPMRVFHASITYLTLIFVAVAIDPLLPF